MRDGRSCGVRRRPRWRAGGAGGSGSTTGDGHDAAPIFDSAYPGGRLVGATGGTAAIRSNPGAGGLGGQGYVDSSVPTEFDGAGHAGSPGAGPTGLMINFAWLSPGFGGQGGPGHAHRDQLRRWRRWRGGGGYGGGGGGGDVGTAPNKASGGAGGGGGSSYAPSIASSPTLKPGVRTANGLVTITFNTRRPEALTHRSRRAPPAQLPA